MATINYCSLGGPSLERIERNLMVARNMHVHVRAREIQNITFSPIARLKK
jgi:hypothetical protein